jgi:hypothetical protein
MEATQDRGCGHNEADRGTVMIGPAQKILSPSMRFDLVKVTVIYQIQKLDEIGMPHLAEGETPLPQIGDHVRLNGFYYNF